MNYQKLESGLAQVLLGQRDNEFREIFEKIHCMSRPRVYAIINACVSAMEPGELYVEVGTYQGGSLCSALLGNESMAIGVDSFSEFKNTNNYEITRSNLDYFVGQRAELINSNFDRFFAAHPDLKIQVYYYDGAHDYETQLAGMEAGWNFLGSGSLILVDDYTYPEVNKAVNTFVANHMTQVKFKFVYLPNRGPDDIWWNGVVVLQVV